ncbi:hypothetical protein B0H14DRAFT_2647625 [Mycena olivaceomarginata]|nr:hypothetical protein B0H14DRAFT_2647625 [Mycena olivaceomarginata]
MKDLPVCGGGPDRQLWFFSKLFCLGQAKRVEGQPNASPLADPSKGQGNWTDLGLLHSRSGPARNRDSLWLFFTTQLFHVPLQKLEDNPDWNPFGDTKSNGSDSEKTTTPRIKGFKGIDPGLTSKR